MDQAVTLDGGFADPVFNAQSAFRIIMDAMARPGHVLAIPAYATPPVPLSAIAGTVACTLLDVDTPFWLDQALAANPALQAWLTFHTGARAAATPVEAHFALVGDPTSMPSLERFALGSHNYPDQSTTLILQVGSLDGGVPLTFAGPGIKGRKTIAPQGLPAGFTAQWHDNGKRFPCGVDLILTSADAIACLPRTARLVETES
ncbi:MAG: phosphonate C-P lyase system protein PhnH [Rhizobiales bacterium]|nr:phosphonate C-P lyase system protein PhnH [Hyphomicrobiales bacterium]